MAEFSINLQNEKIQMEQLRDSEIALGKLQAEVEDISNNIRMQIASQQKIKGRLKNCKSRLGKHTTAVKLLSNSLDDIILEYETTEKRIINQSNGRNSEIHKPFQKWGEIGKAVGSLLNDDTSIWERISAFSDLPSIFDVDSMNQSEKNRENAKKIFQDAMNDKRVTAVLDYFGFGKGKRNLVTNTVNEINNAISLYKKNVEPGYLRKMDKGDYFGAFLEYSKGWIYVGHACENILKEEFYRTDIGKVAKEYYEKDYPQYEQAMKEGKYIKALGYYAKGLKVLGKTLETSLDKSLGISDKLKKINPLASKTKAEKVIEIIEGLNEKTSGGSDGGHSW